MLTGFTENPAPGVLAIEADAGLNLPKQKVPQKTVLHWSILDESERFSEEVIIPPPNKLLAEPVLQFTFNKKGRWVADWTDESDADAYLP